MQTPAPRTFAEERRGAILDMLEHSASVQVADIARAFGVSSVTARGDLDALAEAGKLRRTHGGAVSLHRRLTVSMQDRRVNLNADAKRSVARAAADLVRDGDTVLVDSGTTALEFVRTLGDRTGVTVVTADITIADLIDESMPSVDVVLLGGTLRKGHRYLYGPLATGALETLHADLAAICPGSFIPHRGFATDFPQMAELKAAMIRTARKSVALLDASKISARGAYVFAPLDAVCRVVVDEDPDGVLRAEIDDIEDPDRRPRLLMP